MMSLACISIRRPVAAGSCILMLVLFGLYAWNRIGIDAVPEEERPYVTVTAVYPGANPAEIETELAKELEDTVGTIDGVRSMNTRCMEDVCRITLEFERGRPLDDAAREIRDRIDRIRTELPPEVEPPVIAQYDPDVIPVATLMLTGDLPLDRIYDYADETLLKKFSSLPGVAEVRIIGGEPLELRITLDTEKLTAAGLTVNEVLTKLRESNLRLPVGRIRQGRQEVNVTYDSEFNGESEIGALEIGMFEKRRVYLRDVARITMESAEKRTLAFYDGEPGVMLKIIKKSEANTVQVVGAVDAAIDELERDRLLPSGMKLVHVRDSGTFARAAADNAWREIGLGIVAAVLILSFFLAGLRPAVIAAISISASMVMTFPVLELCGYSFNAFTLSALGISIGTLAANSFLVIAGALGCLKDGESPKSAAAIGTNRAGVPLAASTLAVIAIFVPIGLTLSSGGRHLAPFAVTAGAAALASLLVSFTLTPILAATWLRAGKSPEPGLPGAFRHARERGIEWVERGFGCSIEFVCRHRIPAALLGVVLFAGAVACFPMRTGVTFLPECDRGEFLIRLEFPSDYGLESTRERTLKVAELLRELPDVAAVSSVIGQIGQNAEGVNLAEITIITKPETGRSATLMEMREMLRRELRTLTDCRVTINIPSLSGEDTPSLELEITGENFDTLEKLAVHGTSVLKNNPAVRDADNSVRIGKPGIRIIPDRTAMQNLGISSSSVGTLLRGSIEGLRGGSCKVGSRSFDIRVKLDERTGYNQFPALPFRSEQGKPLRLGTVTELRSSVAPLRIDRSDRRRVVKLYGNPGESAGLEEIARAAENAIEPELPQGYRLAFAGTVREMRETYSGLIRAAGMALPLVYLLLAALLVSWRTPFLILPVLLPASAGVFAALWLAGIPLSVVGTLGSLAVVGFAAVATVLIVGESERKRAAGQAPGDAVSAAVKEKFRTILAMGFAAVLGMAPMAFWPGTGSELRASCAIPVIGGILGSMLFGLYLIPAFYVLFAGGKVTENGCR